jgi:tetratricopeptide (TPR) repeat protein
VTTPGSPAGADARPWAIGVALTALVALVYWQVGGFAFVNFDDDLYVYANPQVAAGLTWQGVAWAFTAVHASNWHPLTWLSHMADVTLFGLDAGWHHRMNVLFHWANTVGLFLLLRMMTGSLWRSALVAALFAIHPLHVESVAWVSERKDVLSTSFWLLSTAAYVRWARTRLAGWYLATAGLFALGLLSKPMLVTLPLTLLLLDAWPLGRLPAPGSTGSGARNLLLEKAPLLALSALSSMMTLAAQAGGGSVVPGQAISLGQRLGHAAVSLMAYLEKAVWPSALAMYYPYDRLSLAAEPVPLAVAVLAALTGLVIWQGRARPYLAVGWLWFLVTLLPVIGIIQVGNQAMADRYTYVPLIGPFVALAWGAGEVVARWPAWRRPLAVAAGVTVLSAAWAARAQAGTWRDSFSLYGHAIAVTTRNWTAWNNLAYAYHRIGRGDEAARCFREALRARPGEAATWRDLGLTLVGVGDHAGAIQAFREAVRLRPSDATTWTNLGASQGALGRHAAAVESFEEALRWRPEDQEALFDLGIALAQLGQPRRALEVEERLARLNPALAERLLRAIEVDGAARRGR